MSYIEGNLVPGERIIYRAHLHWSTFLAAGLVLLVCTSAAIFVASDNNQSLALVIFLIGTLPLAWSYLRYRCSEFAVTDKRVLVKTGVIARHTLETLLNKIENIGVEQTLMGRLLNYGTIQVTGTGSTKETFTNIAAPLEFRKQVQGATLNYDAARSGPAVGQSSTPLSEREERDCPFCAERILVKAKVCRFCGREIPTLPAK
ncbi:MAG TPA: PH domain-containing protein [Nitrospirales bacterium]